MSRGVRVHERGVRLLIQYATRMRHIVLALYLNHIFRHFLINDTILEKNVTEHKMFVLIFSTNLFEIFLILTRIQRDVVINV